MREIRWRAEPRQVSGGAIPGKNFLAIMKQSGLLDAEIVSETDLDSSSITECVLFGATKTAV